MPRYRHYIRSDQIRKYDGINGISNIVNALKFIADVGERKYFDEIWTELLERAGPWPKIMWEGLPPQDVLELLKYAVIRFNTMPIKNRSPKFSKIAIEKVQLQKFKSGVKLFEAFKLHCTPDVSCLFMRVLLPWDHWPVVSFIRVRPPTGAYAHMNDAYGLTRDSESGFVYTADPMEVNEVAANPKRLVDTDYIFKLTRLP